MSAAWVAACVRGRRLVRRTANPGLAHGLVEAGSWEDALRLLAISSFGEHVGTERDATAIRRSILEATVWRLRVLAGWLPAGRPSLARLAAAPIEIGNVEQRVAELDGAPRSTPIPLGSLSIVSHRLASVTSTDELRHLLARSAWGDPGGDDPATIAFGLRVAWARRAANGPSVVRPWARSGAAVLVARERFLFDREVAPALRRDVDALLGPGWHRANAIASLRPTLPEPVRDVLADVDGPEHLWRAEAAVIRRVARDAEREIATGRYGPDAMSAVFAALLVDTWRAIAGIEGATTGRVGAEVLDAVAA